MKVLYDIKITGFSEANKNLELLNQKVVEQEIAVKSTKEQVKAYEDELKKLSKETGDTAKQEAELNEQIKQSKVSLQQNQDELKKINKERSEATKIVETHNQVLQSATGSNEQLKAQLKLLTAEYNSLSKQEREGTERGRELQAQTLAVTNELKANEKAIGDNRRNVGNYGEAIESALKATGLFGKEIKIAKDISDAYQKTSAILTEVIQKTAQAQNVSTTATQANAVTTVKDTVAKVANNVATKALAVGTKIATTAQWLWNAAMSANPIIAMMTAITAIITAIAIFTKFLLNNKKANEEATKATEKGIMALETQTKSFKKANEEIEINNRNKLAMAKASGASAEEIRKLSVKLADEAIEVNKSNIEIAKATFTRERYSLALLKNSKASDEVIAKQKELVDSARETLKQELDLLEKAQKDKKQILINNAIEVKAEETKLKEQQKADANQQAQKNKELAEEAKKREKERLEQIKAINRTAQEAIEYEQAQKIKSLGLNKDINKMTTEELMALNKINDAYSEQIAKLNEIKVIETTQEELLERRLVSMELQMLKELDLVRGNKEEELRIFTQFEERKKAEREKYLQEQIQQIQSDLEPIFADSGDAIGQSLGLTPEDVAKKEALLLQLKKSLNELTPAEVEVDQPQVQSLQNMLGLDEDGVTNLFTTLGAVQNALNDLGNLMGSITERNKKNIQSQVKEGVLSQEQADKQIAELERKAFQRQKRMSITQALVNGALAITRILADVPKVDFGVSTGILIGSAVATTATQVGAISAQKFATGGYVSGKGTATSDSIPAMLSNGEYVINAGAVQAYGSGLMDMINSFQFPKFATGGLVAPAPIPSQQSRIQEVGQSIQDQVVEVINVESSFTNTQNKVRNVERARTF